MKDGKLKWIPILLVITAAAVAAAGQSTVFNYQGRLLDGTLPANASYDLEFRLFSVAAGGSAIGTVQQVGVPVSNGVFTVSLDFGNSFDGAPRWLEILVKPAGSPDPFTILSPRQPIASSPYSIRSLNASSADISTDANNLGGIPAGQFVITTDARLSDARAPLPDSPNYIQNTTVQQSPSNFNVSGNGTLGGTISANAVTSATQFNIGVNRMLALGTASVFAGPLAGISNTTGSGNSFFGQSAGRFNTNTSNNSFFGRDAGLLNTAGDNSFFGAFSGDANTTGTGNSFFGRSAGSSNTIGNSNAFFGFEAGMSSTTTDGNSFFGARAGRLTTAIFNAFFGNSAGSQNVSGERNAYFGYWAGRLATGQNNSFFGALAGSLTTTGVANSFFGESAGEENTTGSRNTFLGRWSGTNNTTGADNTFVGFNSGLLNATGSNNVFIGTFAGSSSGNGDNLTMVGANSGFPSGVALQYATAIGADAIVTSSNTVQLGRANGFDTVYVPGLIRVDGLGTAGATSVCRNGSNLLSTCSSSLRYKTSVKTFTGGLDIVRRLRPISFKWKDLGTSDVGFGAEEVNAVEPLLTTLNSNGEIEGVKYAQITTVLVNAVRELSDENDSLKKEIAAQRNEISALRRALCRLAPADEICKEAPK